MRAPDELLTPAGLPPIVHCAKPSLSPSLERIRSVTRAISQAPAAAWPRGGGAGFPCGARAAGVGSPINGLFLDYLPLVIFLPVALAIALVLLLVPFMVAYKAPDPEKLSAYECGFNAFDDARMKFDVRFYLVAILFIIFDLEMSFLFPWAIVLGDLGLYGYWSMM